MPLIYDPLTAEVTYNGNAVVHRTQVNGISRVTIQITYECQLSEWMVPVSWLDRGVAELARHQCAEKNVILTLTTNESDIEERYEVRRTLRERAVAGVQYIWRFHESNPESWPSPLDGHDYERGLVLDATAGRIYDAYTRNCCEKLSRRALARVQAELLASPYFGPKAARLL